ncbi:ApaG domain containing protein [Nitzschia inconspicua]|uniref:ApaG domain containing protein n=1 Tax=Nitzschia inconspicua TaxID=303405 RepID=A0A9K3PGS3_9STRA|nr:ApaG domain containing protein [Nitzschia inconspicua]KAG7347097.1 ApaG domain containing protein [Nitzschia inconspicua]
MIIKTSGMRLRCFSNIHTAPTTTGRCNQNVGMLGVQRRRIIASPSRNILACSDVPGDPRTVFESAPRRYRSLLHLPNSTNTKLYHTSLDLEKEERIRLTTLRLYRILQRTCTDFDMKAPGNDSVLLQPILEAPDWGRHVTFTPPTPTQMEELFRLFYVWNDSVDERGLGVFSAGKGSSDDTATPTSRTTTPTMAYSSTTASHSSIDEWYHELVTKSRDEDDDLLNPMTSMTCWTSQTQLREAVRTAFRSLRYQNGFGDKDQESPLTSTDLHKWAIKAMHILQEQQVLWKHSSVATTDGVVRIVATSRCIGITSPAPTTIPPPPVTAQFLADSTPKYRFAYRIRVENVSDDRTIQLLGRYWHISEEPVVPPGISCPKENGETSHPIIVDSPRTGAVGQLPVLHPGQVFEYMSGTDLATPKGTMKGHLYMARVPSTTKSAMSGDIVDVLLNQSHQQKNPTTDTEEENEETKFFEATVAPFPLEAE